METNDTPGAWPATPDDAGTRQQDAARAVRMRLAGNTDAARPTATLALAAAKVRQLLGGAR